jgi:hypothetical protein
MNVLEILNTIRSNASAEYQARIPEASRENMESIRYAMIDGDNINVANEFMSTLLNKVVKTQLISKVFKNPLKSLKKGKKPLGDTVEEIYTNFIKAKQYDQTGAELLNRNLPDVKTLYHRMNLQLQYPITVSREQLSKAFISVDTLEKFIADIIKNLYNSAELDEFINMKQLFKSAVEKNAIKVVPIPDPLTSPENAKEFIKAIKTVSGLMVFPSTSHNAYLTAQSKDTNPITTFSRKEEQVLIIDTATDTTVSVDVLASIFNMSVADFNETKKIVIDSFPDPDMRAVLIDEQFAQIFDDLIAITKFENGAGLYDNYYLNVWQTMAYSILVNAVAFKVTTA